MEKTKNILDRKLERIRLINNKILDELLIPGEITKTQEKQILKLKQERYKEKARYYEKLKELTSIEIIKQKYDKMIKECKNAECVVFYYCQSKNK